jgi:hypothetical protein
LILLIGLWLREDGLRHASFRDKDSGTLITKTSCVKLSVDCCPCEKSVDNALIYGAFFR